MAGVHRAVVSASAHMKTLVGRCGRGVADGQCMKMMLDNPVNRAPAEIALSTSGRFLEGHLPASLREAAWKLAGTPSCEHAPHYPDHQTRSAPTLVPNARRASSKVVQHINACFRLSLPGIGQNAHFVCKTRMTTVKLARYFAVVRVARRSSWSICPAVCERPSRVAPFVLWTLTPKLVKSAPTAAIFTATCLS